MYIKTDSDHNITQVITVGDVDPHDNQYCYVEYIPPDILADVFSYQYENGRFSKRLDAIRDLLQEAKTIKIKFLKETCHSLIEAGVDVGEDHYSLTSEDQINLSKLTTQAALMPNAPIFYHADGKLCRQYTPEEMLMIATIGVGWVTYHTTYFNFAKAYIETLQEFQDVVAFKYGDHLNQQLELQMREILTTTGITFDQTLDDPFDYNSLSNPLASIIKPGDDLRAQGILT